MNGETWKTFSEPPPDGGVVDVEPRPERSLGVQDAEPVHGPVRLAELELTVAGAALEQREDGGPGEGFGNHRVASGLPASGCGK